MKLKRILAVSAVFLIFALYAGSVVCALIGSPLAQSLLMTSLFLTVVVPALLYLYSMFLRLSIRNKREANREVFEQAAGAPKSGSGPACKDGSSRNSSPESHNCL
ncbi:MAG: hypothetical protein LIV11_05120 [Bacillota bacterium]|nr:hypothetical protein [Bacillota bacterium]